MRWGLHSRATAQRELQLAAAHDPVRWRDLACAYLIEHVQGEHNCPVSANFSIPVSFPFDVLAEKLSSMSVEHPEHALLVAVQFVDVIIALDETRAVADVDALAVIMTRAMLKAVCEHGVALTPIVNKVDAMLPRLMATLQITDADACAAAETRWLQFAATWRAVTQHVAPVGADVGDVDHGSASAGAATRWQCDITAASLVCAHQKLIVCENVRIVQQHAKNFYAAN